MSLEVVITQNRLMQTAVFIFVVEPKHFIKYFLGLCLFRKVINLYVCLLSILNTRANPYMWKPRIKVYPVVKLSVKLSMFCFFPALLTEYSKTTSATLLALMDPEKHEINTACISSRKILLLSILLYNGFHYWHLWVMK